ncbi:cleavage and polyadenylation specificity factor subunit 3-like [Halichondria panicea]|uniref:cleavage and polyadenylation specificity factor subunit 3-like n=1 Tax=Halichondria panicea TaxID=6063 RepID=UPI00312B8CD0
MATKRRAENGDPPSEESDLLTIRPLGAGQEVGRSCIMLEFKNKKIMLDCGIHPGLSGMDSLPYTDMIEADEIDLLLITHFHLDHCGALPWFLEKTTFKGRVFMTHATKAVYRWLLSDYVKVSNISSDQMLYTEKDLEKSMDKIETIDFHQEVDVNGVRFWCYVAGHVLGAAMFMIEIAGVKILYTGDFSCEEDRHLMAAEVPAIRPDILISESTFGIHVHEKRETRETRFTATIHDIVTRGGRCLIPVFALGRAQELLLILDEYWAAHPELHDIPVYYASALAKKCMAVYQTFIGAMNDKIKRSISNPFIFKHISNLKNIDAFDDMGPCVVMASPGMMQSGLSRQLFEAWCTDKRNGVLIAGYCVEGTLAKHVMTEPAEIVTMTGQKLPLRMSVDYISFAAHSDYDGTSAFIKALRPPHVVLVHGEANEMGRLKAALLREFEDMEDASTEIYTPRNTQAVELYFRGEKMAKVMGGLAGGRPEEGQRLSGVLIKRGFNYHLIEPSDLANYTDLATSSVKQRQMVSFEAPFSLLTHHLRQLSPDATGLLYQGKQAVRLFDGVITVVSEENHVVIEWLADGLNDMFADAVLAVVLRIEANPVIMNEAPNEGKKKESRLPEQLLRLMREMFGPANANWSREEDDMIVITVDSCTASLDPSTLSVEGGGESLNHLVTMAAKRLQTSLNTNS